MISIFSIQLLDSIQLKSLAEDNVKEEDVGLGGGGSMRSTMPASIDRIINRTEDIGISTSITPPTLPHLEFESNDYHILDLLSNESFTGIDFASEKPNTPLAEAFEQEHSDINNDTNVDAAANSNVTTNDESLNLQTSNIPSFEQIIQNVEGDDGIYNTLRKENATLSDLQQDLTTQIDVTDEIWNDLDCLTDVVARLCYEQSMNDPPPRYSYNYDEKNLSTKNDLPKYSSSVLLNSNLIGNEKAQRDLEYVISAIQRVYTVAPQLDNQRVELNSRQKKEIMAAAISTTIQKLSRGRYEEQRAESSSNLKHQTLNKLIEQIIKSSERSFLDQRVELNSRQIKNFEIAKLDGIVEKLGKNRMTNQDWHPPEQLFIKDLTRLTDEFAKSATNSMYASQRFHLTPAKEKDMFMNSVFKRVEKLHSYRMVNQDADPPFVRREQEAEQMVSKMQYSPSMDSQRAIWSPKRTSNLV
ncbi:11201_t:CDS:2 [Entrophospora sp. SA101]|nr:11201_t:CDS:2 [Entrophospora sp. SA101]